MVRLLVPLGAVVLSACQSPCPKGSERRDDGLCYLIEDSVTDVVLEDSGRPDSGEASPFDPSEVWTLGDPILEVGAEVDPNGGRPITYEWTDAAVVSESVGIVTGQGGYGIIDLSTGELVRQVNTRRMLRVATDGDTAVLASRTDGLLLVDVRPGLDTDGYIPFEAPLLDGHHETVDIEGDRVLIGWRTHGGVLTDLTGRELGRLPADDAFAVGLQGSRAVLTDARDLVLFDITDPAAPVELDRAEMVGEGRDIGWDSTHLAVGMGGLGTSIWSTEGDRLTHRGDVRTPGTALSVDVDGQFAWIGAWRTVGLVDLTVDPPTVVGHQDTYFSAIGLGAGHGKALVGDWFASVVLEGVPGVAGPELVAPLPLFFDPDGGATQPVVFENAGPFDLDVTLSGASGYVPARESVTVPAQSTAQVSVTAPDGRPPVAELAWTSTDADEPSGSLAVGPADQGIGTEHEAMALPGFELPSGDERIYDLAEMRGKVVVLCYWALF